MSNDRHATFAALHVADHPLLLANAWDAGSARLFEAAGAPALATSSAAVAWSRGYPDGDALPRADLLDVVRGITRVCMVPLSVDIETGYSDDPRDVAALVCDLVAAGAVGINIEDGTGAPALLADKIIAVRTALGATPVFVNARTDVVLASIATGDAAVAMVIERQALYAAAGADGGFVPGLVSLDDAAQIAQATALAVNVMARPGLPTAAELHRAGVRRISSGPWPYTCALATACDAVSAFLRGDLAPLYAPRLDFSATNALFKR